MMKKLLLLVLFFFSVSVHAANWDCISRNAGLTCNTWRMAVPGGWLVSSDNNDQHYAMVYFPDPGHMWEG